MDPDEAIIEKTQSKKTIRRRTASRATTSDAVTPGEPATNSTPISTFLDLINQISKLQQEFDKLQKEIEETKQAWVKEQKDHEQEIASRNTQEELDRKRSQENYEYEVTRRRKVAEDEFNDKKAAWEKQLKDGQDQIDKERTELEQLRKLAESFESQKDQASKEAQAQTEKQLTEKFETETKLREQEIKAEKEVLNLKISNLASENARQKSEIETLRKALDEATRQVKDIAVKVIESGNTTPKTSATTEV